MLRTSHAITTVGVMILAGAAARADQTSAECVKDNTLYQSAASNPLSNGSGPGMFCGKSGGGIIHRALMKFDVASVVPAGSTINSVTLRLQCTQSPNGTLRTCTLYKLLADWGEGTSYASGGGGGGDVAAPGDATWFNRFQATATSPAIPWTTPGGDFSPISSASTQVGAYGTPVSWGPSSQMVADVQSWLDNPSTNFGWVLRGVETSSQTARKFGTREEITAAYHPKLSIDYTPPATCNDIDFNNDGLLPDTQDIADFLAVFSGAACPGESCDTIDFNNDGSFPDSGDIDALLRVFSGGAC
ncbi:MAG: DNRLRE domain-containing protein [Phycisphaerales bacterium]